MQKNLKKSLASFVKLSHKEHECSSWKERLHFSYGCFMVPRLSHGNVPERGQGREEMPFWLKESEKKNDDLLRLGFV